MAIHDHTKQYMVIPGYTWQYMVLMIIIIIIIIIIVFIEDINFTDK